MSIRVFTEPEGRPIGRPKGVANSITTQGPPGLRHWISGGALSTDFLVIEDFKYSFNAHQVPTSGSTPSEDILQMSPWEIKTVDAGTDGWIQIKADSTSPTLEVGKGADTNDQFNLVYSYEPFDCTRPWAWEVKLMWEDVSVAKVFVGLHIHKNAATVASAWGGNCIGFANLTDVTGTILGSGALKALCRSSASGHSGTENSVATIEDDTYITLGCEWDGTTLRYYVNGAHAAAYTTNIPADGTLLAPTVAFTSSSADQQRMWIDHMAWYAEGA